MIISVKNKDTLIAGELDLGVVLGKQVQIQIKLKVIDQLQKVFTNLKRFIGVMTEKINQLQN